MFSNKYFILLFLFIKYCNCASTEPNTKLSVPSNEIIKDIGDEVEFKCTVTDIEDFSAVWSRKTAGGVVLSAGDSLILKDKRFAIIETKNDTHSTYTFKISSLVTSDMGNYECQVSVSSSKKLTEKVNLIIKHPAYILENETPSSYTLKEGQNGEIKCAGEGYPKPSISWKRENNNIMPSGGHLFSGNILKISSVHRFDRGIYICMADNSIGKRDEKLIRVDVEFPPVVSTPKPKVAQACSYGIELECEVEGFPAPAVIWSKKGSKLETTGNYLITSIATAFEKTNSVLRITSVSSNDYGDYYCNATNKLGHSESKINLFETGRPDINYPIVLGSASINFIFLTNNFAKVFVTAIYLVFSYDIF